MGECLLVALSTSTRGPGEVLYPVEMHPYGYKKGRRDIHIGSVEAALSKPHISTWEFGVWIQILHS
jgi:hypothetical protein